MKRIRQRVLVAVSGAAVSIPSRRKAGIGIALVVYGLMLTGCSEAARDVSDDAPQGAATTELVPIPELKLDRMEPRVRDQIRERRAMLDRALSDDDAGADRLAALFGRLGQVYFAYEFEAAALASFTNASRLAPSDYRWAYYLGHLHQRLGNPDPSLEAFERARSLNPAYLPAPFAQADLLIEEERLDEAERLLSDAREMPGGEVRALIGLGEVASLRNDHEAAIRYLEAARAQAPEASALNYPLGLAYRARGDMERARYFLERRGAGGTPFDDPLLDDLEALATGAHALKYLANEAYLQRRFADAAAAYRKAIEAAPEEPESRVNLAAALTQLGDQEAAIAQLETALALDPEHGTALFNMATLLARQGRDEEAVAYYERAIAHDPAYVDAQFNLANARLRLGEYDAAASHFARVTELDPKNSTAWYGESVALIHARRWAEARVRLETAIPAHPGDLRLANTLARLLAASPDDAVRDGELALAYARRLVEMERSVENLGVLAMALAEVGRYEEAITIQEETVAAVRAANRPDLEPALTANLERYRRGEPSRNPLKEP